MKNGKIANLVFDFSRGRIRVPKKALRMMGCPRYVRLLINTNEHYVAIEPGDEGESKSYRVPDYIYETSNSFDIKSLSLIQEIKLFYSYGPEVRTCSLTPRACLDNQFVIFSFPDEEQKKWSIVYERTSHD